MYYRGKKSHFKVGILSGQACAGTLRNTVPQRKITRLRFVSSTLAINNYSEFVDYALTNYIRAPQKGNQSIGIIMMT